MFRIFAIFIEEEILKTHPLISKSNTDKEMHLAAKQIKAFVAVKIEAEESCHDLDYRNQSIEIKQKYSNDVIISFHGFHS